VCAGDDGELVDQWEARQAYLSATLDGVPTHLDNLLSLCDHHHRLLHEHGFSCRPNRDSNTVTFTGPDGRHLGSADLIRTLP
jgi:hypothetical protein